MKQTVKYVIKFISIWVFLNFILNETALFMASLLNHNFYSIITDSLRDLEYLAIQALLFGLIFTIASKHFTNKIVSSYLFVIFQSLIFHVVFLLNIETHDNTVIFSTTWDNIGLKYLDYNGTETTYLIGHFLPLYGNFEDGIFIPENIYIFYFLWIFTPLVYFALLTWLTMKVIRISVN